MTPIEVMMFIECSTCKYKLSESIKVKKGLLEYSFARYLENLVENSTHYLDYLFNIDTLQDQQIGFCKSIDLLKTLPRRANIRKCCPLSAKNRVFMIGDLFIRFQVGFAGPYSFDFLDYNHSKSLEICKKNYDNLTNRKKIKLIELQCQYLQDIYNTLIEIIDDLIEKSMLSLTLDTLDQAESILNSNNPLAKDSYNKLLLGLIPIFQAIENQLLTAKKLNEKEFKNHLQIDEEKKRFFEQMMALCELLEKHKEEYEKSVLAEKESAWRSKELGLKSKDSSNNISRSKDQSYKKDRNDTRNMSQDDSNPEFELDNLVDQSHKLYPQTPTIKPKKSGARTALNKSKELSENHDYESVKVDEEGKQLSIEEEYDKEKKVMSDLVNGLSYYLPDPDFE